MGRHGGVSDSAPDGFVRPPPPPFPQFDQLALREPLASNIQLAGFRLPTPVQKQAIPIALKRRDLMACAQTGRGSRL